MPNEIVGQIYGGLHLPILPVSWENGRCSANWGVAGEVWSRPGLDRRTKSLVTIATLAALGRTLALELNIRMALSNGATRQEVSETLLHIAAYAGFPASWEGLALARKVFRELDSGSANP